MDSISIKQSLGFFDLPTEIRLQILEFTDLNPGSASGAPVFRYVPIWNGQLGIPKDWREESKPLCRSCARKSNSPSYCLWRRFGYLRKYPFTRLCGCRSIPSNLFIVSKQMKAEAEYTLFKFNGFEFFPSRAMDVCQYFKGLTDYNVQLIRDLRFTFSYQQCAEWSGKGRDDWRLLLNWINHNGNLRNLSIVIDVESHLVYPNIVRPLNQNNLGEHLDYVRLYEIACEIAIEAVIIREKLQNLHLKLPFFDNLEELIERQIMGDNYNSRRRSGLWKTLEYRFARFPASQRLPPWHNTIREKIMSRYKEVVYLMEHPSPKIESN